MSNDYIAYAFAGGEIGFVPTHGSGLPKGALFLASGDRETITSVVSGLARHGYDNETLLVPGCPEAPSQTDAYRAFCEFFNRVQKALGRHSNVASIRDVAQVQYDIDRRNTP